MAPSDHRATLAKRRADVSAMFDGVAARYDLMNDLMTGGLARWWRHEMVRVVDARPGQRILDLAAGTGASSVPYAAAGARVVPTDLSLGMLQVGKRRHRELGFTAGDALALPFADNTFHTATISYGLRNVENTVAALAELRRVTRPGGHLVVCEFSTPTSPTFAALYRRYVRAGLPALARVLSSNPSAYSYLGESIAAWPDQDALAQLMISSGWDAVRWRNLSGGIVAIHHGRAG